MLMRVHTCVFMFVSISSGAIGAGFLGRSPSYSLLDYNFLYL